MRYVVFTGTPATGGREKIRAVNFYRVIFRVRATLLSLSFSEYSRLSFGSCLGECGTYVYFHGRAAGEFAWLYPIYDLDVFTDPVIHPADADRGRQGRIRRANKFDRRFSLVPIRYLVSFAVDYHTSPLVVTDNFLDLQTNLRVCLYDRGFLALGRINVYS